MPGALSFQQAEQPLEHASPVTVWKKPAMEKKVVATENTLIAVLVQSSSKFVREYYFGGLTQALVLVNGLGNCFGRRKTSLNGLGHVSTVKPRSAGVLSRSDICIFTSPLSGESLFLPH